MVFNSYVFLFYFFPAVVALFFFVRVLPKAHLILIASYVFYGWCKPEYMLLMLFSTAINFFAGLLLEKECPNTRKRLIFAAFILLNIGLFSYFKYFSFAVTILNDAVGVMGLRIPEFPIRVPEILLPIGISFYTFQGMSYIFDVYRGDIRPTKSFIDFAAYIAAFPQLVAGPIVRAHTVLPYLRSRDIPVEKIELAIHFFVLGLAKKVFIADTLGIACDAFHEKETVGLCSSWISIYAEVFHWYFDFSAYSDMAIGLGHLFGFSYPQNFNSPLKSPSMTELVVKWHMTLISWFRDYLYIPLGGNRKGTFVTYRNVFLIMFLSGVWHGAGWTYTIWAFMIAFSLVFEQAVGIGRTGKGKLDWLTGKDGSRQFHWLRVFVVLTYYSLCFSFFTAPDISKAIVVLKGLAGLTFQPIIPEFLTPFFLLAFFGGGFIVLFMKNTWELSEKRFHPLFYILLFVGSVGMVLVNKEAPFMYFRF